MEVDINNLVTAFIAGGGIWAAIRIEIKYLWKHVDRHEEKIQELEKGT